MARSKIRYVKDLPAVATTDVRKAVGSRRKFNSVDAVTVYVDGVPHVIQLLKRPANISSRPQRYLCCENCYGPARILRIYENKLFCSSCLEAMGFRYRSQKTYQLLGEEK